MKKYKYLIPRRIIQAAVMFLFFAGNAFGWNILRGNLSSAKVFDILPLSDPFAMLQSFSAGVSVAKDALTGALVVLVFYALLGGRLFCGWVCPVNMITDAANKLRSYLRLDAACKSWDIGRNIRYWATGLSIGLSIILGVAAFEWISPIGMLHRGIIYGIGFGWAFVLTVFLFDLFAVKNGFCGHLCPLGGFYSLAGRFGFLRIGYDKDKCTSCMKCVEICPEKQVLYMVGRQSGAVLSGECINCGRCVEVCDDDAVNFSNIYSKKNYK
ncbi:MAG: quinol dehydrogenase ferredoxin subunit NapH [Thermodesulfovibrionia bacterium]|nr:quinol dehydrogenase ferredoxin subunit NapH [Thermodesulfovibrionia bacterium]